MLRLGVGYGSCCWDSIVCLLLQNFSLTIFWSYNKRLLVVAQTITSGGNMKSLSSCICHDLLTPQQGRLRKTFLGKHQRCYAFLVRQIAYFILSTYFVLSSNPFNIFDQSIYIYIYHCHFLIPSTSYMSWRMIQKDLIYHDWYLCDPFIRWSVRCPLSMWG